MGYNYLGFGILFTFLLFVSVCYQDFMMSFNKERRKANKHIEEIDIVHIKVMSFIFLVLSYLSLSSFTDEIKLSMGF